MAIEPSMKDWPDDRLRDRLSTLDVIIAGHENAKSALSKSQVKKQNKQVKERNHITTLLNSRQTTLSESHTASNHTSHLNGGPVVSYSSHQTVTQAVHSQRVGQQWMPATVGANTTNPTSKHTESKAQQPRRQNTSASVPVKGPATWSNVTATTTPSFTRQEETMSQTVQRPAHSRSKKERDPIVAPSAASGGTPEPSPLYLAHSVQPSSNLPHLPPILVVIDLNGTILHRPSRASPTAFVERPFAQEFLSYVFSNFTVMIWSSARPENTQAMCGKILSSDYLQQVVGVWGRDRLGLSNEDYNRRVQVYKRLQLIWEDPTIAMAHPYSLANGRWNQTNTILLDDSLEKARSEPFNLVPVPEFVGRREDPEILRKVAEYLDLVKFQTNVSSYMKQHPFNLDEIVVQRSPEELARMQQTN